MYKLNHCTVWKLVSLSFPNLTNYFLLSHKYYVNDIFSKHRYDYNICDYFGNFHLNKFSPPILKIYFHLPRKYYVNDIFSKPRYDYSMCDYFEKNFTPKFKSISLNLHSVGFCNIPN